MVSQVLALWNQTSRRIELVSNSMPVPVSLVSPTSLRVGYTVNITIPISVGTSGNSLSPVTLGPSENTTPVVVNLLPASLSSIFIGHLFLVASQNCRVRLRLTPTSGLPSYITGWIPLVAGSGFVLSPSPVLIPVPANHAIDMELATYENISSSSDAVNVYVGGTMVLVT